MKFDNRGRPSRGSRPGGRSPQRPAYPPQGRRPPKPVAPHPFVPHANSLPRDDGPPAADAVPGQGVLELHPRGYGFLRNPAKDYAAHPGDPYVSASVIAKNRLREGVFLTGLIDPPRPGTGSRLSRLDTVQGLPPDEYLPRNFDDLTPIDPSEHIRLETNTEPLTTRVMDLLTPIGKGQRGLIVAPPRTGKTILLQHIAQAVALNHPEMHLIMLLIDERPEEVTDMKRTIRGEVVASSSDRDSASHARTAQLVMERAKRLAEQGKQAFVLLDSLTRLARAYNKNAGNSGRTMSGGIDVRAMEIPKRLFGTARAFEEGGSLTVMGTALVDTGSRMDEVIFQEFKGTGNMELVLDRKLSDRRVFPSMDIAQSGTRKEERLLTADTLKRVVLLRRSLMQMKPVEAMESLVKKLGDYKSNAEFLERIAIVTK